MQCSSDCSVENPGMSSSCPDQGWYIAAYDSKRGGWVPHAGSPHSCKAGYRPVPLIKGSGSEGVCKIFCCELVPTSSSSS